MIGIVVALLSNLLNTAARAYLAYGWAKTWGDPNDESIAYGTAADSSGNVYVVGYFYGSNVDFDPGPGTDLHSAVGNADAYVVKYDSNGNFLWARTWGSTQSDEATAVSLDSLGNVYITGKFAGVAAENVDFDGTSGTDNHIAYGNNSNLFIIKYNADGTYGWGQGIYGAGNNKGLAIAVASDGGVYATGFYNGTVDFDPTGTTENHTNIPFSNMFLTKYNTSGTYQWTKSLDGSGSAEGDAITVDTLGSVYIGGFFANTIDFDPTGGTDEHTYATTGGYVTKYDSAGNYLWVKTQIGAGSGHVATTYGLTSDSSNNIYATGRMTGTIDFDPGTGTANHTSNGGEDIFLQKLDSDGNYVWANHIGGGSNDRGYAASTDSSNNVYIGGYWSGTVDFDPSAGEDIKIQSSDWSLSMYASAYNSSGNYLWTKITNNGQQSDGYGITAYNSGLYLVGDAYGDVDFDPEGAGDIVSGATGWGSSALVKWATAAPSTPTPAPTTSSTASSDNTTTTSSATNYSPAPTPLSAPSITSASVNGTEVTLNFVPGVGPQTSYTVYYGTTPTVEQYAVTGLGNAQSTSVTIGELFVGLTYFFQLVPVNGSTQGPPATIYRVYLTDSTSLSEADQYDTYSIIVSLYDLNNEPLDAARVTANLRSGNLELGPSTTNSEGSATLTQLPAGTYDVFITLSSGEEFVKTIVIDSSSDKIFTFQVNTTSSSPSTRATNSSQVESISPNISAITQAGSNFAKDTLGYLTQTLTPANSVKIAKAEVVTTGVALAGYGLISSWLALRTIVQSLSYVYASSSRSLIKFPADLFASLTQWLTGSIGSTFPFVAFIKRKRKKPGIVFNAIKNTPIQGAYVVFFSKSGNLKSAFSDQEGRYQVQPNPDDYEIKVAHNQYLFPSQQVNAFTKSFYENLYQPGELIQVTSSSQVITGIAVPLDPKSPHKLQRLQNFSANILYYLFQITKIPFGFAAAFITTIALLAEPSPLTLTAFLIVLAFWLYLLRASTATKRIAAQIFI